MLVAQFVAIRQRFSYSFVAVMGITQTKIYTQYVYPNVTCHYNKRF